MLGLDGGVGEVFARTIKVELSPIPVLGGADLVSPAVRIAAQDL